MTGFSSLVPGLQFPGAGGRLTCGSNADRRMLVALTDGFRESTESWTDLLRDCRRRGMRAPVLAVGDGALGFWKAVREVFPDTREQRCWWHKQANVLAALPKSAHPGALAALKEIYNAEDIDKARVVIKAFEIDYGAKYPKAVAKIVADADVLLEFYRDTPPSTGSTWRTTLIDALCTIGGRRNRLWRLGISISASGNRGLTI